MNIPTPFWKGAAAPVTGDLAILFDMTNFQTVLDATGPVDWVDQDLSDGFANNFTIVGGEGTSGITIAGVEASGLWSDIAALYSGMPSFLPSCSLPTIPIPADDFTVKCSFTVDHVTPGDYPADPLQLFLPTLRGASFLHGVKLQNSGANILLIGVIKSGYDSNYVVLTPGTPYDLEVLHYLDGGVGKMDVILNASPAFTLVSDEPMGDLYEVLFAFPRLEIDGSGSDKMSFSYEGMEMFVT